MTRQETLDNLQKLNDMLDSMPDEELYDHMFSTSPSFRKTVENVDEFLKDLDDGGKKRDSYIDWCHHDSETASSSYSKTYNEPLRVIYEDMIVPKDSPVYDIGHKDEKFMKIQPDGGKDMIRDSLGDRMKSYEAVSDIKLVDRMPVIIRLDGKAFHTLTKNIDKPYDLGFSLAMAYTTKELVSQVQNCVFGYTQSDEISLLLVEPTEYSESWFGNRLSKILSVSASIATGAFRDEIRNRARAYDKTGQYIDLMHALFDARAFNVPRHEVVNYFIWRQQDCIRNAILGAGQVYFSQKQLNGVSCKDIIVKLKDEAGIDFDNHFSAEYRLGKMIDRESGLVTAACDFKKTRDFIDSMIPEYGVDMEVKDE